MNNVSSLYRGTDCCNKFESVKRNETCAIYFSVPQIASRTHVDVSFREIKCESQRHIGHVLI